VSDIDAAAVESLKVLDPNRPIREADIERLLSNVRFLEVMADWPGYRGDVSVTSLQQFLKYRRGTA
jgi:hypothetical protein